MSFPPYLLYTFFLGSALGLGFYFLFGGRGWAGLVVYWVVAVAAFAAGQAAASAIGINLLPIGQVNVLEGSVTSLLALGVVRALWPPAPRDEKS